MAKRNDKVGENQFADENDIFSFLQSAEMNYGFHNDELEIHLKKEAQVYIPAQRSETQDGDRGEEYTTLGSQKLKSEHYVHHFTKIKNDGKDVSISCKYYSKTYKWFIFGDYGTYRKHLERHILVKPVSQKRKLKYQGMLQYPSIISFI